MGSTLEQWKEIVDKDLSKKSDAWIFDICDKCNKGIMKQFSPSTNQIVCNENCQEFDENLCDLRFLNKKMMTVDKAIKELADKIIVKCANLEKINTSEKGVRGDLGQLTSYYENLLDKILQGIIDNAEKMRSNKSDVLNTLFPKLEALKKLNGININELSNCLNQIYNIQGWIDDNKNANDPDERPNPANNNRPSTFLDFNNATIEDSKQYLSEGYYYLERAELLVPYAKTALPLDFSITPELNTSDIIGKLYDRLTAGIDKCFNPKAIITPSAVEIKEAAVST